MAETYWGDLVISRTGGFQGDFQKSEDLGMVSDKLKDSVEKNFHACFRVVSKKKCPIHINGKAPPKSSSRTIHQIPPFLVHVPLASPFSIRFLDVSC